MTRRSLFEARRSVWDLRSHLLENSTLVNAVGEVAKLMSASSGVPILVGTSGPSRKLPAQVENNLLRITQEALANALKHAHAAHITVNLAYGTGKVSLRIADDGVGFDTDNGSIVYAGHFGLLDMSERAEKMGSSFKVISAPREGTEIIIKYSDKDEVAPTETQAALPARLAARSESKAA
jgi:signal transduction histidine kinase